MWEGAEGENLQTDSLLRKKKKKILAERGAQNRA